MKIKAIALLFCTLPLAGCLEPPQQKAPPATVAPAQTTAVTPKRTKPTTVKTAATKTPKPIFIPTGGGDGAGGGWGG